MSYSMAARVQRQRTLATLPLLVLAAAGIGALVALDNIETIRAMIILSALLLVSLLLFWVVSRSQASGPPLLSVLWISFGLKLLAMLYRGYGGVLADAYVYSARGRGIAAQLTRGEWPADVGALGSGFVRLVTGLFYYVIGVTFSGISVFWTWLGLLGMLFFYLAFSTAFPQGNRRLYLLLIFLYPSMLLWTSSLGKDALMILFLGMAAYGAARMQQRLEFVGLWWLGLGIGGTFMIRPHLAAVFVAALGASFLNRPMRAGMMAPVFRLCGVLAVAAVFAAVVTNSSGYVSLEEVSTEEVFGFIGEYQEGSATGGSAFEQVDIRSPLGIAVAVPTILFRPFPWEANNPNALVAALEGIGLLALVIYRRRSVIAAVAATPRNSYMLLCAVYILLFIFLFTAIGNFGIIARQRASQLFPFMFMLIAYLPPYGKSSVTGRSEV